MWFSKKKISLPLKNEQYEVGSLEELWVEFIELRGSVNKLLSTLNKTLRAHGRTIQSENSQTEVQKVKRFGMILPNGNSKTPKKYL